MNNGLNGHFSFARLLSFCLPPIVMMIFTSIYGVIDGFFVSNYVGKIPFAAINLVMPFLMALGGLGFMVGTGGSALVAKTLGEGDNDRANRYFTMMIKLTIWIGVISSTIGFILMPQISQFLGATDAMLNDCIIYGRLIFVFNTAFMLQNVFQTFLTTASKPQIGLFVTVLAGLTNMILDYVFIAVLKLGVSGAALATGIGQAIGGIIPFVYFIRKNDSLLHLVKTRMDLRALLQACYNGCSELMNNISSSIVSMLYNFQLLKYIGENGVAAYGVLMYVQFIFIAVFIGYTIGTSPVISFNFGAQDHRELQSLRRKSFAFMLYAGTLMAVSGQFLAPVLAKVFVGYDVQLHAMTTYAFRVLSVGFVITGVNIFISALFTSLNNGTVSAMISFLRTLVFQMSSVLLLPLIFDANGIWWATIFAEICSLIVSLTLYLRFKSKYHY